jgi:hypothetical protein
MRLERESWGMARGWRWRYLARFLGLRREFLGLMEVNDFEKGIEQVGMISKPYHCSE